MRLFVAALFLALFSISSQETAPNIPPAATAKSRGAIAKSNSQQEAQEGKQKDSERSPVPSCDGCFNGYYIEQPHAKTKEEESKEASLDRLYRRYLWATIIGVGGGFIGLVVLICQTIAVRQTARSALLSAQAVINAERARIVAELIPKAARYPQPPGWCRFVRGSPVRMSPEEILRGDHLLHALKFINMGRTVAHISGYQIHYGFFNWRNGALNIEEIRFDDDFDRMVEGSQSCEINEAIDINKFVSDPEAEISTWKTRMVVLVSVTYTHVFKDNEPEQDVFRFVYNPKSMTLRRAQVTEADRLQCCNRTISPLPRKAPSVPGETKQSD
jgi:hypothetical protein